MEPGTRGIVVATVEKLVSSVGISADCRVECHACDGDKDIKSKLSFGTRIVAVDGHMVTTSGELRELLHARKGGLVFVTFEKGDSYGERVELGGSVECDGVSSNLAPPALPDGSAVPPSDSTLQGGTELPPSLVSSAAASPNGSVTTGVLFPAVRKPNERNGAAHEDNSPKFASSFSNFSLPKLNGKVNHNSGKDVELLDDGLSPSFPEFDQLKIVGEARDADPNDGAVSPICRPRNSSGGVARRSLATALDGVEVGSCVICVYQEVNPVAELELTALRMQANIMTINLGAKLRRRMKPEEFGERFMVAMKKGKWFVVVNAHKSISTCKVLEDLLKEAKTRNFEGFSPKSRVVICLEPHPHFPPFLISSARVVRVRSSLSVSLTLLSRTMTASMLRRRVVTGDPGSSSCENSEGRECKGKRRVRINGAVEIVEVSPREVVETRVVREEHITDGRVSLFATFSGVPGDRFLCVDVAGEDGRFAVGSSMGNVYFVDRFGKSLLQTHVHESSIWDISFHHKLHFATACEDGTCVEWGFDVNDGEDIVLAPSHTASLGNDAYCLTYVRSHNSQFPLLLVGGLRHELLLIRGSCDSMRIHIPANAQVVEALQSNPIALVGGSDGTVMAIDVDVGTPLLHFPAHSRKLPALTVQDDNHFFTGSFDSTILSWDYRMPKAADSVTISNIPSAENTHTLKLKGYVTGLHVNDFYMAGSVGENLYLWDVRKLGEVLGGHVQAWKGLSRGIRVDADEGQIITASQDGMARVWTFM